MRVLFKSYFRVTQSCVVCSQSLAGELSNGQGISLDFLPSIMSNSTLRLTLERRMDRIHPELNHVQSKKGETHLEKNK